MSSRFHTPTAPLRQPCLPLVLQIEQAFIFFINITLEGVSNGWKSQWIAGVGRGRHGRAGRGTPGRMGEEGEERADLERGGKRKYFLCRQFSMLGGKISSLSPICTAPSRQLSLPLTAFNTTKSSSWCPVGCRVLWVLPYQHNQSRVTPIHTFHTAIARFNIFVKTFPYP